MTASERRAIAAILAHSVGVPERMAATILARRARTAAAWLLFVGAVVGCWALFVWAVVS